MLAYFIYSIILVSIERRLEKVQRLRVKIRDEMQRMLRMERGVAEFCIPAHFEIARYWQIEFCVNEQECKAFLTFALLLTCRGFDASDWNQLTNVI
ncbi:MAG TPA: hypothetical protein VGZ26_00250 [Pirellulales bacterium]|nr:hypothetical protein [Pirellulales bacterium]